MTREIAAKKGDFHGEPAIFLIYGRFEAVMLPRFGGNLVAFRDRENHFHFLREPADIEDLQSNPFHYGIPVLYPPNRYADGKFVWNGRNYQFPVNEIERNNHLHGFVHDIPWEVAEYGKSSEESYVMVQQSVTPDTLVYKYLPHEFTIQIRYSINANGLLQHVLVRNDGIDAMPCMLGFHTAINVPFASNSSASDYSFMATIGKRWALNDRMLPTGEFQVLSDNERQICMSGISPFVEPMDNHYTAQPQNGHNRMELTDTCNDVKLIYDVGTGYRQWMIWNNEATATEGFFCPEPQVNVVNAPNLASSSEEIGVLSLAPGEIWEETSRLYCTSSH